MAQYNYAYNYPQQGSYTDKQSVTQQQIITTRQEQQFELQNESAMRNERDNAFSGYNGSQNYNMQQAADDDFMFRNEGLHSEYTTNGRRQIAYDNQSGQSHLDARYGAQLATPRSQQDTLGYATNGQSSLFSKQEFEARKNRQQQGQIGSGWRNTQNQSFTLSVQQNTSITNDKEAMQTNEPPMSEDEYRNWLTKNFKHLFDPYESFGGMLTSDFQTMVRSSDLKRRKNLSELFKKLDKDGNNRVSWNEFYTGMKYTKKDEVSKVRKATNSFIKAMTPAAQKKLRREKKQAEDEGEPIPEESYLEAYNCRPPPLFIPIFYVAVWIFFIIYAVELQSGPAWNRVGWQTGFPFQSPLVFCTSVREQAWRFITYSLLHDGYHHVVFNTIFSLLLGIPLECVHKAWRVGPVFFAGILFGSLASSIVDPGTPLIGASGGVYSLIGAHYAIIIMNWEELQDDWTNVRANPLRFLLSGVMRLIFLTVLVILDFGLAFYWRYAGVKTLPTSAVAHIGGLLAGVFVGVPVLRNIDKKPWEGTAFIVSIVIAVLMFLFGVFWNIFATGYPTPESTPCSNPSLLGLRRR